MSNLEFCVRSTAVLLLTPAMVTVRLVTHFAEELADELLNDQE